MAAFTEDGEPIALAGCGENIVPLHSARTRTRSEIVSFSRRELDQLLRVYGFKVADGEWRDYAIDMLRDYAFFSVYRRSAEVPLYKIVKNPRNAKKQGAYSIVSASGQVLKRGHDLDKVLRFFDKGLKLVRG